MTSATRERLLDAAQRLFAERGVDAVSLREINQAAGSRNVTAVQYHFGDRAGVVRAIVERHGPEVDARRHALLDACDAADAPDLRALAGALVRPPAALLATPGGREYLQVWADALNRPRPFIPEDPPPGGSLCRWRTAVEPLLAPDAARLHRRFTAMLYASIELARRARSGPHTDDRLFTGHLVDVIAAVLGAPVSAETRRLAAERDAARGFPNVQDG
ncbi:TetR family transcriptional regulator [Actinomadura parmotrematis]|uniref:TetR family transcriptional regulator n=1 Tax=Actinomadura parmotrematis TaxID=2864039 RepID=A0ABS7G0B1_9ACTN|nr:TetR family transcriptional regulator [Actinomadura parmotrematis]MBW8486123.1 TetR family transcriptional regulator [Actinomadura parmotrematis]